MATVESVEFLDIYEKTPAEVLAYEFLFNDWLKAHGDTVQSFTVVAVNSPNPAATTVLPDLSSITISATNVVRVVIAGGVTNSRYKVTATINTVGGLVRQAAILIRIKTL